MAIQTSACGEFQMDAERSLTSQLLLLLRQMNCQSAQHSQKNKTQKEFSRLKRENEIIPCKIIYGWLIKMAKQIRWFCMQGEEEFIILCIPLSAFYNKLK